jgi:hypothetical protein
MNKIIALVISTWIVACSVDYTANKKSADENEKSQSIEVSYPMTKKRPCG